MSGPSVGAHILERLRDHGLRRIHGYPGDGPVLAIEVGPGLDRAFAARGPVVVEAMTDPEIPPLPPHIELEQARRLTSALRKRDPALRDIIRNSIKGKAAELRNR